MPIIKTKYVDNINKNKILGIYEINDELVSKEENQMLKYKNFGRKSLTELGEKLDQLGLKFGMDISSYIEE